MSEVIPMTVSMERPAGLFLIPSILLRGHVVGSARPDGEADIESTHQVGRC